ncbi:Leucine-rich repeat protein kinase family protein, putative isoform 1 [Hibiscus syriacus]|uniref:Leucine-rich repeat protein kinase family protein, putative isoform 1 n=1 Tax=Hibiscus syriacus TaxID=106335 RepID=A0A6A3BTC7_HIBSY|nr:Leucine-rich repeat protein kinase family protein, putative isoform 1 [Hibiscus syriacus]
MCQLDVYLQQLLNLFKESSLISTEGDKQAAMVSKHTTHYKEYYTVKWAAAREGALAFYCPVWLSKLEDVYSEEDRAVEVKIKLEEETAEREMERQQVAMADREIVEHGSDGEADKERGSGGGGDEGGTGGDGEGDESGGLCEAQDLERSSERAMREHPRPSDRGQLTELCESIRGQEESHEEQEGVHGDLQGRPECMATYAWGRAWLAT